MRYKVRIKELIGDEPEKGYAKGIFCNNIIQYQDEGREGTPLGLHLLVVNFLEAIPEDMWKGKTLELTLNIIEEPSKVRD